MPAKAGIQGQPRETCPWTPAFEAVINLRARTGMIVIPA
jgi:ribosome modulation factor